MADPLLLTRDLSIGYRGARRAPFVVAKDISLSLGAGELVCLIGPNGAGKSTLLRTLAGIQSALSGAALLGGDDVFTLDPRELARRLSVVLTERVDVGNLSAYGLVALGRHPYTDWTGQLSPHDEQIVRWAIEIVGARHLAVRPVSELSDGERQKAMIARALAQEPLVMILDEPTAFLDLPNRVEVMRVLRHLSRTTNRAILLSTHDLDLALRSADRIWLMARDGTMQVGAPEDLVLNGAFEAAFHSEGVVFDQQTGAFKILTPATGTVDLVGDGLAVTWTRRALEREGFGMQAGARIRVEIITTPGGDPCWRTVIAQDTREHASLYSVISLLRQQSKHAE